MDYKANKAAVLDLFDNHILRYIIKDLEKLIEIEADDFGAGGCAIPQAISTFAVLDLIGYITHPQDEISTVGGSFGNIIINKKYFLGFKKLLDHPNFLDSFRDNIRSIMVHRFLLAKYDIAKTLDNELFIQKKDRQIFNVTYFTKITIDATKKIYDEISGDLFFINGFSKEESLYKMNNKIGRLKEFGGRKYAELTNLTIPTTCIQTTSSVKSSGDLDRS